MEAIVAYSIKKRKSAEIYLHKIREFFGICDRILFRDLKEEDLEMIWKKIKNELTGFTFEEKKVFAASFLVLLALLWLNGNKFASVAHSEEEIMTNAISKGTINNDSKGDNISGNHDVKNINEYKLKSPEEKCKEDKANKQASDLCGKDDEEEVKKMKAAEATAKVIAKPRVVRLSCRESNYGHPSRSDTKGKHMDEDCCPDPDEWPRPGCSYDAHGYGIMMSGPKR
jgi:hypothetical protein